MKQFLRLLQSHAARYGQQIAEAAKGNGDISHPHPDRLISKTSNMSYEGGAYNEIQTGR